MDDLHYVLKHIDERITQFTQCVIKGLVHDEYIRICGEIAGLTYTKELIINTLNQNED